MKSTEEGVSPDGKEVFGFLTGVFYLVTMGLSAPWSLLTRKATTVGARAFWFDTLCHIPLLLLLRKHFTQEAVFFEMMLVALPLAYFWHFIRTITAKEHVHSYCIGSPLITGTVGEVVLWMAGLALAAQFHFYGSPPLAIYTAAICSATFIRALLVKERDRRRVVHMKDGLWEQKQMMDHYEYYGKETHEQA